MALLNKVEQRGKMGKTDIIKYQLLTYCFLNNITVADGELECLAILAQHTGPQELNSFCTLVFDQKIYASPQTARNSLTKSEKKGLVVKQGNSRKTVFLNPALMIQTEGNILLDYKFGCVE
jgi:hypothetical protein